MAIKSLSPGPKGRCTGGTCPGIASTDEVGPDGDRLVAVQGRMVSNPASELAAALPERAPDEGVVFIPEGTLLDAAQKILADRSAKGNS